MQVEVGEATRMRVVVGLLAPAIGHHMLDPNHLLLWVPRMRAALRAVNDYFPGACIHPCLHVLADVGIQTTDKQVRVDRELPCP